MRREITNPDGIVRTAQLNHFRDKTDARYATSMWTLNSAPTATTLSITDGSSTYYFKPGDEVRVRNTADGAAEANYYIIYKLHDITTTDGVKKAWWAEAGTGGSDVTLNRVKVDVTGVDTDTVITLTNVTDGTTEQKTWTGTTLTFDNLDTSKTYKVSAPQKAGYALATAEYTLTAFEIFSGVTKTFAYEECKVVLTVGMSDDSATDLARVAPKISINGGTAQVMTGSNGTFEAALNEGDAYEITFTDLTQYGYQAPATISGTKDTGGITRLTGYEYQTTIYTLTSIRTTKDGNVQGSNPSGVGCKLSYTGLQTPVSLTAVNQTAKVPTDLVSSVVITPSTVYGYAASNEGSGQTIQLLYATTAYTLTVSTNQSDAATVLENTVIRITKTGLSANGYIDKTGQQANTEILVPAGTTIEAADVAAHSGAPASASYAESITVSGQVITVTYATMKLSVSLAYEGETAPDLTGVTITVTDTTAQATVSKTGSYWLIPGGHAYKVEVSDDVEGYAAPDAATGTATSAQGASATVTMTYEEAAGFVDLGLPSGLKWAQGNIVKNGSKYEIGAETDYGAYVSWGNIEPHFSANGSTFDDGYNWGSSNSGPYASTPGASIAFTAQGQGFAEDSGYDAARELLGGKWKMPTTADFKELNDNCTSEWVANYNNSGVAGRLFTSKINGATLFFPAAGYGSSSSVYYRGSNGYYWSRSLYNADYGYGLYFNSSHVTPQGRNYRYDGFSVRAVQ